MDSRHFFYTRVDEAKRPFQLWRHELGTDTEHGRPDLPRGRRAVQPVGRSQSRRRRHLRAPRFVDDDRGALPRRPRSDRGVDDCSRRGDTASNTASSTSWTTTGVAWWLKVTNEGATDFRLLRAKVDGGEWREVIPERPGSRLDGVDAFKTFLAISERHDGGAAVRIVDHAERRRSVRRRPARALEIRRGSGESEHRVNCRRTPTSTRPSCACRSRHWSRRDSWATSSSPLER